MVIPKKLSTVEIEPKKLEKIQESHNNTRIETPSKLDQTDPDIEIIDDSDLIQKAPDVLEEDNKPIKDTTPVESTEIIAPELIQKTVLDNKDLSTSMIKRRFGIPYGTINRILGR